MYHLVVVMAVAALLVSVVAAMTVVTLAIIEI
jgi:hypothetical protein